MADNRIEIDIVLNDGTIAKGLLRAEREAVTSGKKIGNSLERGVKSGVGNAFSGLRTTLLGLGAAFAGAFATRELIAAASRQEDAINSLNQALRSAGTFSKQASQDFQDFASELQGRSIIGDEALLEAAALARNFTATNEQAKQLTEAALELSAATGKDLTSSLEQLGKTFGGSLGRLAELVPDLKNLTTEQLKAGEATKFIIDRFGGAAEAKTRTFSGAVSQLSNTFGDLLEEFGFAITRSTTVVSAINSLNDTFKGFIDTVKNFDLNVFINNLRTAVAEGVDPLARGIRLAASALTFFVSRAALGGLIAFIPTAISGITGLATAFLTMARNINLARVGLNLFKASATLGITLILDQIIGLVVELGSIGDAFEVIKLRAQQGFELIRIGFLKLVSAIVNNPLASLIYGDRTAEFKIDIQEAEDRIESLGNQIQAVRDQAAALRQAAAPTGASGLASTEGDSGGGIAPTPIANTEQFDLVKEQTEFLKSFVIANQEFVSSNRELVESTANGLTNASEIIDEALESGQARLATFQKGFQGLNKSVKKASLDLTNVVQNTLARGISQGVQVMVNALQNGENAFEAFGKFTIQLLGDFMIRVGEMAIQVGIAAAGVKAALESLNPFVAIAAGAVLIALGTAFKNLAGGPAATSGAVAGSIPAATNGGGGVSSGQIGNIGEDAVIDLGDTGEQRGRQANIEVNIQGNVLDRRETALEIVQVLEEAQFAGIEVAV